jgi:chromosomal replication initiation ATPase DnaA
MLNTDVVKELIELVGLGYSTKLINVIDKHFKVIKKNPNFITLDVIFTYVCKKHKVNYADLFLKSRFTELVKARKEGGFLALKFGYTTTEVARFLNKDHSTVVFYRSDTYEKMQIYKGYEKELDLDYKYLKSILDDKENRKN